MPRFGRTETPSPSDVYAAQQAAIADGALDHSQEGTEPAMTITDVPETDASETDAPAAPETPEVLSGVTETDTKRRGRPKLSELPPVDLDALGDDSDVPEDEWGEVSLEDTGRTALPRSDAQVKVDNAVKAVHEAWAEAGKPQLKTAPRKRYTVKPDIEIATRAMLTRAGAHLKVRVIQNTIHNGQGMAVITFTAVDRPVKEKATDAPATENAQ